MPQTSVGIACGRGSPRKKRVTSMGIEGRLQQLNPNGCCNLLPVRFKIGLKFPGDFDDPFSNPIWRLSCFDEAGGEAGDAVRGLSAGFVKTTEKPDRVRERVIKNIRA